MIVGQPAKRQGRAGFSGGGTALAKKHRDLVAVFFQSPRERRLAIVAARVRVRAVIE
jgi:hypothetical protein